MSVDATAFKRGMRHLAASVTLITTRHRDLRGGLTATAVCSVSAEPPQILVCVNKTASAHDPIGEAGFFCVNILAPDHRKIAERFAGMDGVEGDERFADMGDWSTLTTGAPVLKGCPVSFDCKLVTKVAAGTHTIYIGEIVDICARCQGPRAALLRRRLRARRAPEEGAAGGLTKPSSRPERSEPRDLLSTICRKSAERRPLGFARGDGETALHAIRHPLCSGADWGVAKW